MLTKLGDLYEAEKHCLKAVEYAPDAKSKANYCGNYAAILRDLRRYDKAEGYFDLALRLNEGDIDIYHLTNYAECLREMGKFQESKHLFERAIRIIEESKPKKASKSSKSSKRRSSSKKHLQQHHAQLKSETSGSIDLCDVAVPMAAEPMKSSKKRSSIFKRNSALNTKLARIAISESNTFTKKMVGKTYSNYALCLFSMKLYEESNVCYLRAIEMDEDNQVRHYNYARLLYDTQVGGQWWPCRL